MLIEGYVSKMCFLSYMIMILYKAGNPYMRPQHIIITPAVKAEVLLGQTVLADAAACGWCIQLLVACECFDALPLIHGALGVSWDFALMSMIQRLCEVF